jgi:hypothetical protein
MLTRTLRSLTVAVALALGACLPAAAAGPNGPGIPAVAPYVAPTAAEATDIAHMRQEEKLARDLYLRFADAWGTAPFAAIANAEQSHMDAMLRLLRKYRLADPVAGSPVGEFADTELQTLYTALLEKGFTGEVEALEVGGLVEETDLLDLGISIANTDKTDILAVYASLACGSRNHLRAFAASLRAFTGEAYAAQVMPQAAVDAIIAQPWERCGNAW